MTTPMTVLRQPLLKGVRKNPETPVGRDPHAHFVPAYIAPSVGAELWIAAGDVGVAGSCGVGFGRIGLRGTSPGPASYGRTPPPPTRFVGRPSPLK
jgi:hypothetical protein